MLFNSFEFLLYFTAVCLLYFLLPSLKSRNIWLLIASYYFYMCWEPIYALLIMGSTLITYFCGRYVEQLKAQPKKQKLILTLSLIVNFGILFLFKYYNFINESIYALLDMLHVRWEVPNLTILLPVGISFYTFQAVGYTIDIYRGKLAAEKNFITYALFVSFFPQLVAGPIERATNLLPQFHKKHLFNYQNAIEGIKLMLWGFFMKLCIGDMLSDYVDAVYNNVPNHNGTSFILATIFFTFQIYCDFGGYSNIAIGAAKFMGFNLMENFHRPYFAYSIKDFWRRWHISLSSWFADYVYIPLGGNRVKQGRHLFNLFITFLVSGIWHGANWTFVLWGALHGTYQIAENLFRKYIYNPMQTSWWSKAFSMLCCFTMVAFAWIFFRANTVHDAFDIIHKIFTDHGPIFIDKSVFVNGFLGLTILLLKDFKDEFGWKLNFMHSKWGIVRYASVVGIICYILLFGALSGGSFLYFQF